MKEIILTNGDRAYIDDEDFEIVYKYNWRCKVIRKRKYVYSSDRSSVALHRLIMKAEGRHVFVDHIDDNPLNNQKSNLRLCTNTENQWNRPKRYGKTSKYKGVCYCNERWHARIRVSGKRINLGVYRYELEAALAYNNAAIKYHGEFANLNKLPDNIDTKKDFPLSKINVIKSSKYIGVSKRKRTGSYDAVITINGKNKHIGSFKHEDNAGFAYNQVAIKLLGEKAKLNTLPEGFMPIKEEKIVKTSKYIGVSKSSNKWNCEISYNKRRVQLGRYNTELEAAIAYNEAAIKYKGNKAKLNVLPEQCEQILNQYNK